MSNLNVQNDNSFDVIPDDPCVICFDEINNLSTTDVCNHHFCFQCIERWSTLNDKCPLCKRQFAEIYHDFKEGGTHSTLKVELLMTCAEDDDVDDEGIEIDEIIESDEDADFEGMAERILNAIELQPGESISSRFIGSGLDQNIIRMVIERSAIRGLGHPDPFVYGYSSYNEEAVIISDDTYPSVFPNPDYSSSGNEARANETSNDDLEEFCFNGNRQWIPDEDPCLTDQDPCEFEEAFILADDTYSKLCPNPDYSNSGNEARANETSNDDLEEFCFYGKRQWIPDEDDADPLPKRPRHW